MKKNIYILLFCCCAYGLMAQDCGDQATGVSTNPDSPIQQGNCSTNTFDWRVVDYVAPYYKGDPNLPNHNEIRSPFYKNNGAIDELWNGFAYANAQDMLPEDGWELVVDGITQAASGTPLRSENIAYFVLYNKFTATLRVFAAHYNVGDNDYMVIYLKFSNSGNNNMTGLLNPTQQIAQALDEAAIAQVQANAKLGGNNALHFFYADFPMGYDPCTCIFDKGNLKVEFKAINKQTLNIVGRSWGLSQYLADIENGEHDAITPEYLTNVYNNNTQAEAGQVIFNTFNDLVEHYEDQKKVEKDLEEQYQAYKDVQNVLTIAGTIAGGSPKIDKFDLKVISGPLKGAAKFVEVLGAPLKKKLDAAEEAVELKGKVRMMHSEMTLSGTIVDETDKGDFSFLLPGRKNNETKCNDPILGYQYPYYDEVLGRFALLETPKATVTPLNNAVGEGIQIDRNSIKYMFNPAALINEEKTQIYAALVVKGHNNVFGAEYIESLSTPSNRTYITSFLPLDCIEGLYPRGFYGDIEVQLRLLILYEFNTINSEGFKNQAFEVLTYPVELTLGPEGGHSLQAAFINNISENLNLSTQNFTSSEVIMAWESITINGNLTAAQGAEVRIVAPEINMIGGTIGQGIRLEQADVPPACSTLSPFAASELVEVNGNNVTKLENYCNYGNYQANQSKNALLIDNEKIKKEQKLIPFRSTPNPFTNTFNIEFELDNESATSLMVFDALGRVVETVVTNDNLVAGEHLYQIDGSRLKSGIYYVRLQTDDNAQTIKIVKQ